jgi:WD40 repeat protein
MTMGPWTCSWPLPESADTTPSDIKENLASFLHPNEPIVANCSIHSTMLQVRDLRTGALLSSAVLPWNPGMADWSPDGRTLAATDWNSGLVRLYAFDPAKPGLRFTRELKAPGNGGTSAHFNPAGDRVATRGWNSRVHLFDANTGRLLFSTHSLPGIHYGLHFDPNGTRLGLWFVADAREFWVIFRDKPEQSLNRSFVPAVHPSGRIAVREYRDGFGLFDLDSGSELAFVRLGGGCRSWLL